jgi:hypothetical protein
MNRMTHDAVRHADDADFTDLRRFVCGAKGPKDFNMDNPLQAAVATRGMNSDEYLTRRDARPCVSTYTIATTTTINHTNHISDYWQMASLAPHFQFSIKINNKI